MRSYHTRKFYLLDGFSQKSTNGVSEIDPWLNSFEPDLIKIEFYEVIGNSVLITISVDEFEKDKDLLPDKLRAILK